MQPAGAPRTPGSPTRSSYHERDREREREREQERDRERERGGRQSRTSPVEDREDREERGSIARQNLGPPAAISGNQGLPLSLSLEDRELWTRFQCITNEMIVTKNGRYRINWNRINRCRINWKIKENQIRRGGLILIHSPLNFSITTILASIGEYAG